MRRWAQLQDGKVHWIFEADELPEFAPYVRVVEITDHVPAPEEGWDWDEDAGRAIPPPPPSPRVPPPAVDPARLLSPPPSPRVIPVAPERLFTPPAVTRTAPSAQVEELGYFGNIWVRKLYFAKAGDVHPGHTHQHDHVSILAQGKLAVRVQDVETIYEAPTFVIIRKGDAHTLTALADETVWWCLYALRDLDGQVVDIFDPQRNDPLGIS